ncbi:subfamily C member 21 [Hyphodiscus hymeniophilus]|uniref:Subfamily C member 21 n=1 Tax=Hyphodiscus hymeniophilus TaxID=353542 RepID=A0A9P6VG66_9HELO|nr:subfamily C member 21 [Hyphodiscus hymeniophilus]
MGAEQSSSRKEGGGQDSNAPAKRDYYEVLEITRQASDDEIKKAYRRKALELHPDRNYGDVDVATAKFAEVQSAYEVLSDPQERSWYDSHRESILRGDSGGAGEEEHYEHNVHLTSTSDIVSLMSRFNANVPFTDAPNGFYGILAETFAKLAREEDTACDWEGIEAVDYPDFGSKDDEYEDVIRPFYRVWINFSTKKSFSWRDRYRASDAPDRATRRLIEKENKRFRDEGIREFNDTVRALVSFVRKRDPRYIPNSQTEEDRQKILRDAAAAQAARSRAANQAKLKEHAIADWTRTKEPLEEVTFSESEEEEVEHIECVACGKIFKSEKQYETHEKSKKHQKAVQQLQREMWKENKRLNLHDDTDHSPSTPVEEEFGKLDLRPGEASILKNVNESKGNGHDASTDSEPEPTAKSPTEGSDTDDEYGSREDVENRLLNSLQSNDATATSAAASEDDGIAQPKLGKAKAKRAKKAARQEAEVSSGQDNKCAACNQAFPSKTKLFDHLKEVPKHAQLVPKAGKGKGRRR